MHLVSRAATKRILLALVSIGTLGTCATGIAVGADERVRLNKPFEFIFAATLPSDLTDKFANLAQINPDRPLADENVGQTLSMFGREDLIAASSRDYKPKNCAPLPAANVLDEIARRARQTSIVIINESHERSEHRGFIAEVARRLRPLGYDTLAIETLKNNPASTPLRYQPTFQKQPTLPFLEDGDGYYLSEAGFGRLGRNAKALGYRLIPYEFTGDYGLPDGATDNQRIAVREEGQALALTAFLKKNPGAKLLIHVGYSHAAEVPRADGAKWMAERLKEKTGIDPLTISQTTCRGGSGTLRLSALSADEPAGSFDLLVDHPSARFAHGRPGWRKRAGDKAISIPRNLRPSIGWRVIEARPVGEPATSVPMDRVAIRPGEDIALMLPPGNYDLRVIDVTRAKDPESSAAR